MILNDMHLRFRSGTVNVHPTHLIKTVSTYLVAGVQSCCVDQYTSYGAGNKHEKFQCCTVDIQATTVV